MKMQAPDNIGHFEIENVTYERDETGHFSVDHPGHVEAAQRLGAHCVGPDGEVLGDSVAYLDPRDAKIAELQAQLAAAQTTTLPVSDIVTPTLIPETAIDATGDTSPPAGGIGETEDGMAAALALNPDFDEMGRDEMVEWLNTIGVVVPSSISKSNARKAIDEAIADHQSGQKD